MSREDEIAKLDEELAKLGIENDDQSTEEEVDDEDESEDEQETIVEAAEPAKVEEPAKEERPTLKLSDANAELPAATLGYKLREESRKREALEKELADLKTPKVSKEENYEGYIESEIGATKQEIAELRSWKQQQEAEKQANAEREGAFRELKGYENEAAAAFPDFDDASKYAKSMIAASIKLLEPDLSSDELAQKTIMQYATKAAQALNANKHPGQAIYEMAHSWGYKKADGDIGIKQDNGRPQIKTAPLSVLAENKKKSSGMTNSGGNGKAFMNMDAVSSMTNAERMKLTESDWARLEAEV